MYLPPSFFCFTPLANVLWQGCAIQNPFSVVPNEPTARKRIVIVGGGTGGLAALKTFLHDIPKALEEEWEVVLYEQRPNVGGVWFVMFHSPSLLADIEARLEDPKEPHEPQLPETPLYPQLHTNTPNPTSKPCQIKFETTLR